MSGKRVAYLKKKGDWMNLLSVTFKIDQSVELAGNSSRLPLGVRSVTRPMSTPQCAAVLSQTLAKANQG